jgi:hypothetical protein
MTAQSSGVEFKMPFIEFKANLRSPGSPMLPGLLSVLSVTLNVVKASRECEVSRKVQYLTMREHQPVFGILV